MVKKGLFSLLACVLLATSVVANPTFTFTHSELLGLGEVHDVPTDSADLDDVTDDPTNYDGMSSMLGEVGYWGNIKGNAEIWIGDNTGRDLSPYNNYALAFYNDDDDVYRLKLFVWPDSSNPSTAVFSSEATLKSGDSALLFLDLTGINDVDSVGFVIASAKSSSDVYHISASPNPAPGSILLCSIGICLVGWLRRRRTL